MSIPRTPTGDLYSDEYAEARQADCNRRKEEYRATLSAAEQARLDIIESVSRQLEEAQIPFLLYADSVPFEDSTERCCWWQFNKVGYEKDWEEMNRNAHPRHGNLMEMTIRDLSKRAFGTFVWFDTDNQPRFVAVGGKGGWVGEMTKESDGDTEDSSSS